MKTFADLKFKEHKLDSTAVQARLDFDNGTFISVIGGGTFYGDGKETFEVYSTVTKRKAAWAQVDGWLDKKRITARMRYLQSL
tara:strand:- start:3469 stop:3717 length:249 start_codon:yes stop_codon:yes gene_type:complete